MANEMVLQGKILIIFDEYQKDPAKEFKSRDFVLDTRMDYNGTTIGSTPKFQCINKNTKILDGLEIGDEVKVSFALAGTVYEDKDGKTPKNDLNPGGMKAIGNVNAWKIEMVNKANPKPDSGTPPPATPAPTTPPPATRRPAPEGYRYNAEGKLEENVDDDLPF